MQQHPHHKGGRCNSGCATSRDNDNIQGGGWVDELGKLAIPLGLIAAKEGVDYYRNRDKKAAKNKRPASAPTPATKSRSSKISSSSKTKKPAASSAVRRRVAFGGATTDAGDSFESLHGYGAEGGDDSFFGGEDLVPLSMSTTTGGGSCSNSQATSGGNGTNTMYGGEEAAQHAMIAQEFRRMANEIGAFLAKRDAAPAKKPPAAPKKPAKKPAAAPKKPAAAPKKPTKKVGGFVTVAGHKLGGKTD